MNSTFILFGYLLATGYIALHIVAALPTLFNLIGG